MKESIVVGKAIVLTEDVMAAKRIQLDGEYIQIGDMRVHCGSWEDAITAFEGVVALRNARDLRNETPKIEESPNVTPEQNDPFVSIGDYVLRLSVIHTATTFSYATQYVGIDKRIVTCASEEEALEYFNHLKKLVKAVDVRTIAPDEETSTPDYESVDDSILDGIDQSWAGLDIAPPNADDFVNDVINDLMTSDRNWDAPPELKPHNTAGVVIRSIGREDDEDNLPESATDEPTVWRPKFGNVYFEPDKNPENGINQRVWGYDPELDDLFLKEGRVYSSLEAAEKHKY